MDFIRDGGGAMEPIRASSAVGTRPRNQINCPAGQGGLMFGEKVENGRPMLNPPKHGN